LVGTLVEGPQWDAFEVTSELPNASGEGQESVNLCTMA